MQKQYLVTDFIIMKNILLTYEKNIWKFLFLIKQINLKIIFFLKDGKIIEKKLEYNRNVKIYKFYLDKLIIYLNKYHKKNFSKRYWELVLTPWLWWFVSSVCLNGI